MMIDSAPEAVLVDFIWNAESLSPGMNIDVAELKSAILRS
jgi:hypothetical protein